MAAREDEGKDLNPYQETPGATVDDQADEEEGEEYPDEYEGDTADADADADADEGGDDEYRANTNGADTATVGSKRSADDEEEEEEAISKRARYREFLKMQA